MTKGRNISAVLESPLRRSPRLRRLAEGRTPRIALLLARAGKTGSPLRISKRALSTAIVTAAVSSPLAVFLGVFVWPPLAAVGAAPAIAYLYPEFALKEAAAARREGAERELPFFAILVNVLGGAGLSLYSILQSSLGKGTFSAMEGEALLLRRDVEVFGSNPLDALERLAAAHPSKKFADYLLGYSSKVRSGGDVPGYLSAESGDLLRELEGSWGRYSARVGAVGSLMVTMFGVVPLLLLVVGFFSPGYAVVGLATFALLVVPLVTVGLVSMTGRMQPMGEDPLRGSWTWATAAALTGVAPGILTGQPWLLAALPLFLFSLVYGLSVRARMKAKRDEDRSLPNLMKDLMEFKRLEYDLGKSIVTVSSQCSYGEVLDDVLVKVSARLRSGIPLDEARPEPRTALGKVVFFVLGQMAYSGGGTLDTMFQLTHYTSRVLQMKDDARSEAKPYLLLSYVTPVLLVVGVAFVGGVLSNLGPKLGATGTVGQIPFHGFVLGPALFQAANLLIVVSAAALGIVGSKMADFTARNTLRSSTNLAVAVTASFAIPLLNISALFR